MVSNFKDDKIQGLVLRSAKGSVKEIGFHCCLRLSHINLMCFICYFDLVFSVCLGQWTRKSEFSLCFDC